MSHTHEGVKRARQERWATVLRFFVIRATLAPRLPGHHGTSNDADAKWHLHCTSLVMQGCYANPPPEDGHVLIVEDERVSRKALGMLLRACGYKTVSAGSA